MKGHQICGWRVGREPSTPSSDAPRVRIGVEEGARNWIGAGGEWIGDGAAACPASRRMEIEEETATPWAFMCGGRHSTKNALV